MKDHEDYPQSPSNAQGLKLLETINEIESDCQLNHYNENNKSHSNLPKIQIINTDDQTGNRIENSEKNQKDDVEDEEDTSFNYLKTESKYLMPRKSTISRQSIEMFLSTFPSTDGEYVDKELFETVNDIIKSDIQFTKNMRLDEKIRLILKSHKFNFFLIILVTFDILCVLVQVIIDIIHKDLQSHLLHIIEEIAEVTSLCILSFFLLNILANVTFVARSFFKSKLEMFDALIVMTSFSLEIVSLVKKDSLRAVELGLIVFRFWRVLRIVMTIVISVEKKVFEKLEKLKEDIRVVVSENDEMEMELKEKQTEIRKLKHELDLKSKKLAEAQKYLKNREKIEQANKVLLVENHIDSLNNKATKKISIKE